MRTALQVIREHGPKYLGELYTENVGPIVGMLGPAGLAELATMKSRLLGYGMGPAAMLYASEAGAGSDVINNVPRAEYTGPNMPLPRPRPRWSDARAEVANLLARDRDRARNRALDELLAHYPPPSAVITDPDINAERESILRALFEDREGLVNTIEDRADGLMPQRFAGGGLVKLLKKYLGVGVDEAPAMEEQKMLMGLYRGYAGDPRPLEEMSEVFASPQRKVGEYYAEKRAAQTGREPHVEMLMVDPFAGTSYRHATAGTGKKRGVVTTARKLKPESIEDRYQLKARGGKIQSGRKGAYHGL